MNFSISKTVSLTALAFALNAAPALAVSLPASTTAHIWGPLPLTTIQNEDGAQVISPADQADNGSALRDRGLCKHPGLTITQDPNNSKHWVMDFPSQDSCRDPVNVPDWFIDMYVDSYNDTAAHGSWVAQKSCWVGAGSGTFDISLVGAGAGYLQMSGYRAPVTFQDCPGYSESRR